MLLWKKNMWSLQDFFFFEFLRGVEELFRVEFFFGSGFFECLEPRTIASLVLCMRSKIMLPHEAILHQGEVRMGVVVM